MKEKIRRMMISETISLIIGLVLIINVVPVFANEHTSVDGNVDFIQPEILPVAVINYTPQNPRIGEEITFDASESYQPDNDPEIYEYIAEFLWDFDNDGEFDDASGDIVNHTWYTPGYYNVSLKLISNTGLNDTTTFLLIVYMKTTIEINNISEMNGNIIATIHNVGESECEVNWTINVSGGILNFINISTIGTEILVPGDETQISTIPYVMGLGFIRIRIEAYAINADLVEIQKNAFVLGRLVFIF